MKTVLKQLVPRSVRAIVRGKTKRVRDSYKLKYYRYRLSLLKYTLVRNQLSINLDLLRDVLPNIGPIPVKQRFSSASEIVATFPDPAQRRVKMDGFEGFALDDAVFDEAIQLWEMWSFAPLAGFLATFGHANYRDPSVLELGCGPAHLFFFLRRFGVWNYVGIDGNPWFVKFNPYLSGYEKHFSILNIQEEIQLYQGSEPLYFDIICSFEVLEHIREDKVDNFIKTIRNHMHSRSVAFCTTSLQSDMDVHVLVRDRDWWLQRFAKLDLYPLSDEAELTQRIGDSHPFNWNPSISNVFALEIHDS